MLVKMATFAYSGNFIIWHPCGMGPLGDLRPLGTQCSAGVDRAPLARSVVLPTALCKEAAGSLLPCVQSECEKQQGWCHVCFLRCVLVHIEHKKMCRDETDMSDLIVVLFLVYTLVGTVIYFFTY